MHKARSVCDPNCHAKPKCGVTATIEDGKIIAVDPAEYPVPGFENRICMMGRARLEYQYHPDRMRTPLKRVGKRGEGKWQAISWDEAAALFVENQKRIASEYGSKAVLFHQISGAYGLLTRGAPLRYAALTEGSAIRSSGIDFGVAKGLEAMFGVRATSFFGPGGHSYSDAKNANLTLIWGGNPAVTRAVDHVALKQARAGGSKLICIDPVRSETAKLCNEWISLRPGSNGALALSLANEIINQQWFDRDFLRDHTDMPLLVNLATGGKLTSESLGLGGSIESVVYCAAADEVVPVSNAKDAVLDVMRSIQLSDGTVCEAASVFHLTFKVVADFTPDKAEQITQVPAETIRQLARDYATAKPAAIRIGYGVDRWYSADLTARSIALLACLCGYIGVPGGGVSLVSGGRGVPVKGGRFYAPERKTPSYLSLMEADAAVLEGSPYPINMECISLGNPFNQVKPNRNKVLTEYVDQLEFIAVIDHFMTDTAKQADLVLPACTIFEKTDIVVDEFIQLQQRVVEPEGEAKTDFEIFQLLATAYGIPEYFEKSPQEYIDSMFASDSPLLENVSFERLKKEKVIYPWPGQEPYVGFANRTFPTWSGRIEVYKPELAKHQAELPFYREPIEASPKNPLFDHYPLVLLSSHSRYRVHSTFANLDYVKRREPEPILRIHPDDAKRRQIRDGAVVDVFNQRGQLKIRCVFDADVRAGCVLISEGHWIDDFIEGDPYGLTHDHHSPTTENYAHYDVLVEMKASV